MGVFGMARISDLSLDSSFWCEWYFIVHIYNLCNDDWFFGYYFFSFIKCRWSNFECYWDKGHCPFPIWSSHACSKSDCSGMPAHACFYFSLWSFTSFNLSWFIVVLYFVEIISFLWKCTVKLMIFFLWNKILFYEGSGISITRGFLLFWFPFL